LLEVVQCLYSRVSLSHKCSYILMSGLGVCRSTTICATLSNRPVFVSWRIRFLDFASFEIIGCHFISKINVKVLRTNLLSCPHPPVLLHLRIFVFYFKDKCKGSVNCHLVTVSLPRFASFGYLHFSWESGSQNKY